MADGPAYLDEHHQRISEFAEDYLDEEERGEFVDGLLDRLGYSQTTVWAPPEPQGSQGGRGGGGTGGGGGRSPLLKPKRQGRPAQGRQAPQGNRFR